MRSEEMKSRDTSRTLDGEHITPPRRRRPVLLAERDLGRLPEEGDAAGLEVGGDEARGQPVVVAGDARAVRDERAREHGGVLVDVHPRVPPGLVLRGGGARRWGG